MANQWQLELLPEWCGEGMMVSSAPLSPISSFILHKMIEADDPPVLHVDASTDSLLIHLSIRGQSKTNLPPQPPKSK